AALALVALLVLTPLGARAVTAVNRPAAAGDAAVTGGLDPSIATRIALYDIALRMVTERPLFGYGPDSFVLGVPKYRPESAPLEVRASAATSAHTWAAYVAKGTGAVGLAAFLSVVVAAL